MNREHKLDVELLALKKTALIQVETMQEITRENSNLFAEGILEGWLQALKIINGAIERTKDNAAR